MRLTHLIAVVVALFTGHIFVGHAQAAELPVLKTGIIFTTHHTPFMVAAAKGEAFKERGVWLKPVNTLEPVCLSQA